MRKNLVSKLPLIIILFSTFVLASALVAARILVEKGQDIRKKAADCGGLTGTHCNCDDCHDYTCDESTGSWVDKGHCGSKCKSHPCCSSECGGGGGGGGGITEACVCGGWHEGWCDANACKDHPNDCCGGACMSGLVQCHTLGRCQRPDENCPGGTDCDPSKDCTFSCSGTPSRGQASCNQDCNASTRAFDVCRGKLTSGNCQKCKDCGSNDPPGCDNACDCCDPGKIDDLHDPCWSTCYEKGPGYDYNKGNDPEIPFYNCRNTQSDVVVEGQHVWNCTWEDGKNWWECFPTPTPPTPTPTPSYSCQCDTVKMYDLDWNLISDYGSLSAGDQIYLTVLGITDHPEGLTKGRLRINGEAWQETDQRHGDEFYIQFTIPDYGDYSVEGQVYNPHFGWR